MGGEPPGLLFVVRGPDPSRQVARVWWRKGSGCGGERAEVWRVAGWGGGWRGGRMEEEEEQYQVKGVMASGKERTLEEMNKNTHAPTRVQI